MSKNIVDIEISLILPVNQQVERTRALRTIWNVDPYCYFFFHSHHKLGETTVATYS